MKAFKGFINRLIWFCIGMVVMSSFLGRDDLAWRWIWVEFGLVALSFAAGFARGFAEGWRKHRARRNRVGTHWEDR